MHPDLNQKPHGVAAAKYLAHDIPSHSVPGRAIRRGFFLHFGENSGIGRMGKRVQDVLSGSFNSGRIIHKNVVQSFLMNV